MKALLLYFLFFVFSAIVLVQCAKFFPSKEIQTNNKSSHAVQQNNLENALHKVKVSDKFSFKNHLLAFGGSSL